MGQKVNPISFRLQNTKKWQSIWYDKNTYSKKLKKYEEKINLLITSIKAKQE